MKGWILLENNKPLITSNNSIEVFKTKKDLLFYYIGINQHNEIKRVEIK